jgi:membrane protein implicated in regulation of membrane protease activity
MWRTSLLGAPVVGLGLFYLLPFALALLLYLPGVCLAFWLYDRLAERAASVPSSADRPP